MILPVRVAERRVGEAEVGVSARNGSPGERSFGRMADVKIDGGGRQGYGSGSRRELLPSDTGAIDVESMTKLRPATLLAVLLTACDTEPPIRHAETLFTGGVVWTGDSANPRAEAVLVRDGRIAYVGTNAEAAGRAGPDVETIALEGRMLLPGFVESHFHPAVAGLLGSKLQVIETQTLGEVQAALAEYAAANPDEDVLFGFGFPGVLASATGADGVPGPRREDLDAVVSDRPVVILAVDAHSAWLNTKALEVAGIDRDTPDPLPGVHYYQRDAEGEPTGWAVEGSAFWPLLPRFGIGSVDEFDAAYSQMFSALPAMGVTTVFDAGIPGGEAMLHNALQAVAGMGREGRLPVRYRTAVYVDNPSIAGQEAVSQVRRLRAAFASTFVDVHTVKVATDGTIEGRTAAVLKPYASGAAGQVLLEPDDFARLLSALREAGLDAHVHAIGDRTLRDALDAVAAARDSVPDSDARVAVAHAMLASDQDLARLRPLDVSIQTTPHWAHDLAGSLDLYSRLLDAERGERLMRLQDLWDAAPLVAFGADYPATGLPLEQATPLHGIEIGVTRLAPGEAGGAPYPPADQRMSLDQMLLGYTANGARQLRLERETGVLAVGMAADLVVLERDLFQVPPSRIHAVKVDLTMMAGVATYRREANGTPSAQVEPTGIEPVTSGLQSQRSPS